MVCTRYLIYGNDANNLAEMELQVSDKMKKIEKKEKELETEKIKLEQAVKEEGIYTFL